tara:strand:+ start:558 stop:896 length:339 start_codon:yes stop_codon:yes gene_type:complete
MGVVRKACNTSQCTRNYNCIISFSNRNFCCSIDLFDVYNFKKKELYEILSLYAGLVILEENFRARGGADSMLFELIARRGLTVKMLNLGVEQGYRFKIGDRLDLHESVDIGH